MRCSTCDYRAPTRDFDQYDRATGRLWQECPCCGYIGPRIFSSGWTVMYRQPNKPYSKLIWCPTAHYALHFIAFGLRHGVQIQRVIDESAHVCPT